MRPSVGQDRLVASGLRTPALVVAILAALTVVGLGVHFSGDTHAGPLDRSLTRPLVMSHGVTEFLGQGLADLGNPLPVAVALVVLAALAFATRGRRGLELAVLAPVLAMVMTSLVLKPVIDRTRNGDLAFPSGHTTAVASLAVTAAILLLGRTTVPRWPRWTGAAALVVLVPAVAASLVGRGYHYPTDTMGGAAVATAVVLLVALTLDARHDRAGLRAPRVGRRSSWRCRGS